MSNTSSSRRWGGRALIGAALLALPLTASITYAESAQDPQTEEIDDVEDIEIAGTIIDNEAGSTIDDPNLHTKVIERDGKRFVLKTTDKLSDEEAEKRVEKAIKSLADAEAEIVEIEEEIVADGHERHVRKIAINNSGKKMSKAEMDAVMAEVRADLAHADAEVKHAMKEVRKATIEIESAEGAKGRTVVKMECRGNSDEVATVEQADGEGRTVYLCQSKVMAHALKGLKEARKAIAKNPEIKDEMRANALAEIDRQIKNWATENNEG